MQKQNRQKSQQQQRQKTQSTDETMKSKTASYGYQRTHHFALLTTAFNLCCAPLARYAGRKANTAMMSLLLIILASLSTVHGSGLLRNLHEDRTLPDVRNLTQGEVFTCRCNLKKGAGRYCPE